MSMNITTIHNNNDTPCIFQNSSFCMGTLDNWCKLAEKRVWLIYLHDMYMYQFVVLQHRSKIPRSCERQLGTTIYRFISRLHLASTSPVRGGVQLRASRSRVNARSQQTYESVESPSWKLSTSKPIVNHVHENCESLRAWTLPCLAHAERQGQVTPPADDTFAQAFLL